MTHNDDRDLNRQINQNHRADAASWSRSSIVLGSLAALAVVFGIFYMKSNRKPVVATIDRPAVTNAPVATPTSPTQPRAVEAPAQTRPSTTTGSGAIR